MANSSRRVLLAAAAATPLLVGSAARGQMAPGLDADLEAAFLRRQQALATYHALPAENGPIVDGYGPGERELWDVIDNAEEVIRGVVARTPRGAMIQLWCAMYHGVSSREDEAALTRADFAALDRPANELGAATQLMLAALRSLQAMEG